MYEFSYHTLEPYWRNKVHLHYMDTDSFVLSFEANQENLIEFLKQNKDEFDISELDKSPELYNLINKKNIGKMKTETGPVLVLDNFTALQSKSYTFFYNTQSASGGIQKAKQKGIQKAPSCEDYKNSLFNSETTNGTNYSIRSNLHKLTVQYLNKLALNPFDDKRMYLNPIQSLPWNKHSQKGDCPCILCIKFIRLY